VIGVCLFSADLVLNKFLGKISVSPGWVGHGYFFETTVAGDDQLTGL